MKDLLDGWVSTIFVVIVILGLGILPVVQGISHSAKQLKLQEELMDMYQFNSQLTTDNAIKQLQLEQANEILEQQHNILQGMYRQLMKLQGIPIFPGEDKKDRPSRSEA